MPSVRRTTLWLLMEEPWLARDIILLKNEVTIPVVGEG